MARILVVGGLGWDVPIWLDKPLKSGARIGARSLGPRNEGGSLPGRLGGGAANCAAALACAGHTVWVLGRLGMDHNGNQVLSELKRRHIGTDFVHRDSLPTTSAHILIEPDGERTILGIEWDKETRRKMLETQRLDLSHVKAALFDALIMRADWPHLDLRPPLIVAHLPRSNQSSASADFTIAGADDLPHASKGKPFEHARNAFNDVQWAILTNGAHKIVAESALERLEHQPEPTLVRDATGAGDVFLAGITDALIKGAALPAALAHASQWGQRAVEIEGSAPKHNEVGFPSFSRAPDVI